MEHALSQESVVVPSIDDYALIGDCRAAALISVDGSIDWLCLPRFDSPSIFSAILDPSRGGRFQIKPVADYRATRRYLPRTNVLETTFRTADGACVVRDLMPVSSEEVKRTRLTPEHEVLREIDGIEGAVELDIVYEPRPDYARARPVIRRRGALGLWCQVGNAALNLHGDVLLDISSAGDSAHGRLVIRAGEVYHLSLTFSQVAPAVITPLGEHARRRVEESAAWWRAWADRCRYVGPFRDAVVRSALTLKLLSYAPSGAVIAAPTTSLPEAIGGARNWDYRFCWLRDAAFTLRALYALGYDEEAESFLAWLIYTTSLTRPELQLVYGVYGEMELPEQELAHLAGFAGSRPVRVGNAAARQLQLDVYGEVLDAAAQFARRVKHLDRETARLLVDLGGTVCRRWREPDDGIWEARVGRRHHTHSKVLCWVALDRLIELHRSGRLTAPIETYLAERGAIRADIEAHGFDERLGGYTQVYGSDLIDASLLLLPLYGYTDVDTPRMRSTIALIRERLGRGALIRRYEQRTDDGLPPGEGAFGICSFWLVECLARSGHLDEATRAFEELLGYGNDLGLFAEEIDPASGGALGNFPQAFTHVGLINAALTLAECTTGSKTGALTPAPASPPQAAGEPTSPRLARDEPSAAPGRPATTEFQP